MCGSRPAFLPRSSSFPEILRGERVPACVPPAGEARSCMAVLVRLVGAGQLFTPRLLAPVVVFDQQILGKLVADAS